MRLISSLNRSEEAATPSCPLALTTTGEPVTAVPTDTGNKGSSLGSLRADANRVGLSGNACVADIDIAIADSEIASSVNAQGDVRTTGCVAKERSSPDGRVVVADGVVGERVNTLCCVVVAGDVPCKELTPRATLRLPVVLIRAH